ncbi:hypothetical protein CJF42_25640 [Pseudoalteromonas sp. NBT06-2]|uniref:hypothetical protein n=1 Tax=Pseudoalteromonas sp. NBT06-2 TaxID=2025950 RepID=UPI000BA7991F|nr:hypothetical protein [Pseudoalteromonas sp. NBT06-2]PAJ71641.1 hypothetical protein CJF42_25640 [Pseudoalteromonas sp. NBT06-2]
MLLIGTILLVIIGIIHSYIGEKYLLIRLFRRENLPKLLGSDWFTKRVIRFAWHLTTIAWWGFAAILFVLSNPGVNVKNETLIIIAVVFLLSGIVSLLFTRGKHLSWVFFFTISTISYYGTTYTN